MYAASDFKTVQASFPATVDEVYLEIANHIRDGLYYIISVSASAYSFSVICQMEKTSAEFREAMGRMFEKLVRGVPACGLLEGRAE
jgi:hypothetical protein